ncbi:dipeptidyl aminopeptidase/acylaminoacyl peptidase [Leeuwenhoekiella aestuarii]|uniref:Dipeptidyl aminopeptidase/acylaminoacyl peptidase n=1 Tax=Leeuwenhoekiella aestuarii TaxID=2249426 RepID=A0A4Q0NWT4_9FLAO|nr:S9 family peptidase [Leeuwenhoekiella aestuarii]RXG15972.1 dipeptidyl aminopeptidase/acylaminoacyl peptidase [Leeuwenhoekiella aestuarii]RXG16666.1 dipeptidyl aminopeptidase/acylaminoacyl peptidase [Leeuwenhoekiella aestuarii]
MKRILLFIIVLLGINNTIAQQLKNPSFEEVLSLKAASNAVISPDGKNVVFQLQNVDWNENRYDTELWISKNGNPPFQLTNTKESSSNPKWSPDGEWIAFLSTRGENNQIHAIRLAGGESFQVTNTKSNISDFEWSPDSKQIGFLQPKDNSKEKEKRADKYGSFEVEDKEYANNEIWVIDFKPEALNQTLLPNQINDSTYLKSLESKKLLDKASFSINSFKWSPDGSKIAFDHQPDALINSDIHSDISIYDLDSKTYKTLVSNKSYDGLACWSPSGKAILYQTVLSDTTSYYYSNIKLFRIDIDGANKKQLAIDFDENLNKLSWNKNGIFANAWLKTKNRLLHINPENGKAEVLGNLPERIRDYSFSKNGQKLAFTGVNDADLAEIYAADYPIEKTESITTFSKQIENWSTADSEVITWESNDGTLIEGILDKPKDYDPKKKYPLMVIIHGGPTGISYPEATASYVYPRLQWLNKGALILRPNYRGSAGYGETFRALNVKNLGVGDSWDVLSGVAYLESKGVIEADSIGCMGWSQGGYISAFLATNSDRFKAISVGAGISDWMTYYVSTDVHPFTRQYLKATPWSNREIYEKTSPITNIENASTPTLIQHGEFDTRVPIANAYELSQGLKDVGVESELIIYKGFGHGINKPKEKLAAMWHNWNWFAKYIWGEELELPQQ